MLTDTQIVNKFTKKINTMVGVSTQVRAGLHKVLADCVKYGIYYYEDHQDRIATGMGWDEDFINFLNDVGYISTSYSSFQQLPDDIREYILSHSEGARIYFQIFTE